MFRRASTCLDVFGQLFSKVCAARNIKLLLHLLLGLPNEFSGEVESGSFCKGVTHQSRVIRTKTKITGKQALHKIHKPTAAPSTWSLPSSRSWNKILQEVSTHGNIWQPFAAQPGSNRLQPAPTWLQPSSNPPGHDTCHRGLAGAGSPGENKVPQLWHL